MSIDANTFWMLSILAAAFATREQRRLDDAKRKFAQTFPNDAAALVIEVVQ